MKTSLFISFLLLSSQLAFTQGQDFQAVLDAGKAEFKLQAKKDTANYTKAYKILSEAVKLQPDNVEARYFLGYALDRMNSQDGSTMSLSQLDLSIQASEQFEIVNQLEPKYTGELLLLDPYSKITSIWGSMAIAYLTRHQTDSAKWAFAQGRKRGGFIDPVLAYNRQLLSSCAKNAILITVGDDVTIPSWYIQEVEHFRTDVLVIDAYLLGASWYPKYLKHEKSLPTTYSDGQIDSLNYIPWKSTTISVKKGSLEFAWELRPTYYDQYLLKGDQILLDIFKLTAFDRPLYFVTGCDSSNNLFLTDHLGNEGILSRVLMTKGDSLESQQSRLKNLASYTIDGLFPSQISRSESAVTLLNGFRWAYYAASYDLYTQGDLKGAKKLLDDMERKFDSTKLPYFSDKFYDGIEALKNELK